MHDQLPLYDMLNQFQKGHSHMAAVVKYKDTAESAKSKPNMYEINTNSNLKQRQAEIKGKISKNVANVISFAVHK